MKAVQHPNIVKLLYYWLEGPSEADSDALQLNLIMEYYPETVYNTYRCGDRLSLLGKPAAGLERTGEADASIAEQKLRQKAHAVPRIPLQAASLPSASPVIFPPLLRP